MSLSDKLNQIAKQRVVKARVGIIEPATYPDGELVAFVGYVNEYGTETIPPRPFFRSAVAKNRDKLGPMLIKFMGQGRSADEAMRLVCEHMVDELRESVITWEDPPNAASTIRQKGFNAPLRGVDRLLRNSFSYEIDND